MREMGKLMDVRRVVRWMGRGKDAGNVCGAGMHGGGENRWGDGGMEGEALGTSSLSGRFRSHNVPS